MEKIKYLSKNKLYKEDKVNDYRELIEKCAKRYGNDIAFSYKNKYKEIVDVSYIQFKMDIEKFGTALLNLKFNEKKIGLIAPDRYEWCVSYLSITNTNNIVVPLDYALPDKEIENSINISNIECIVFDIKYIELIKKIIDSDETNLRIGICFDFDKKEDNILSYQELLDEGSTILSQGDQRYNNVKIDKDKMSILLFTSGTTADSKAVMLSQYNICSNITAMTTLIKSKKNDNVLVFLPLHHTLACTASFLFCFYAKFKICFADGIKNIGKNLKEYKIRGLVCVPAVLEVMYKKAIKEIKRQKKYVLFKIMSLIARILYNLKIDIRRKLFKNILDSFGGYLRIVIYGAASTKKEIIDFFTIIGIDMLQGYGLTETSPVIACESDRYHNKVKSTGYPLYNLKVRIDNPDKTGTGEIIVYGPNVMLGYYNDKTKTAKTIINGWLHTGDLGYLDKKGQLFVTGRIKDIIVLKNGKKVNPEELEGIINQSEYVEGSLIYGELQKNEDYKIKAKIVYSKDNELLKEKTYEQIYKIINKEIKEINSNLPLYKHIYNIEITEQKLNKTTTNKIKRYEEMKKITSKQ